MKTLVIYHKGCSDGFLAAAIAKHYYTRNGNSDVEYVAVNVARLAQEIDTLPPADAVLSFDLSYTREAYDKLAAKYTAFSIHDHHIATLQNIPSVKGLRFSNDMSGAMLAWTFYYGEKTPPAIVKYVEDRDLWRNKMPRCHELIAWLYPEMSRDFESGNFDRWQWYLDNDSWVDNAINIGTDRLAQKQAIVDNAVRQAAVVVLNEKRAAVCNSREYVSEIGEQLCKMLPCDYAIVWSYNHVNGDLRASLRSTETGADVNEVARTYGGGGHRNAAGFTSTASFLDVLSKASRL